MDWTAFPGVPIEERNAREEEAQAIAVRDLDGILNCDVFLLLADPPEGRAKYAELGAALVSAMQTGKPTIYVLGDYPAHSVFFFHPRVKRVRTIADVLNDLAL